MRVRPHICRAQVRFNGKRIYSSGGISIAKLTKPRLTLLFVSLIMVALSSVYFALNLAIGLVGLRTSKSSVNQDPVILDSTLQLLQRLLEARIVISPLTVSRIHL